MSLKTVLTTVVAGSQYLIHPQILGTIQETIKPDVIIPVTVLEPEQLYYHLEGTLRLFDFYDDVFNPEFGSVLIEKPGGNSGIASVGNGKSVMRLRNDTARTTKRAVSDLPAGPYILHGPNVHQAWKIYNDTLDAFAVGVYPSNVDEVDGFELLQLPADLTGNHTAIPVPSRLYNTVPPEKAPLKGYRFTVPDSMSLKGVPTTISSTAWNELHNKAAESTAVFTKRLISLGAVVVGKTKTSQFGSGREWADAAAPKNPREDGHQDPAGGAAGAASSLAGYEWLKASTGLDAIGQVLEPAAAQGLFALRTSAGILPLDGAEVSSPKSDAIGIFGTDLAELFHDAVAIVHKSLSSPAITFPKRIVSVTDIGESNDEHKDKHDQFLAAVEAFLGVKSQSISLEKVWASKSPVEAKRQSLQEYMKEAPFLSFCYEFYHQYEGFRKDYQGKFGKEPATEATVQYRWDLGKAVTKAEYEDYQTRIAVFQKWFNDNIIPTGENGDAIVVMPYASKAPRYDAPKPTRIKGVTAELLASLLHSPQVLAPFAQFPYESTVSHQTEYHPVYGTILGPKGSDSMLVKLVEATFQQAQWRTRVDKARFAFPPGQNARKVNDKPVNVAPASLKEAKERIGEL
ncbi:hypothetical protein QQS21_000473 [Conoideocrella luteorostrata]|uniref:Amidase domain-containing protein n=1 Tax=Conoideocrella luteorostrata TaxID=1105319 RepID=A0AAJ0D1A6_9HYPO|nr:hypothetical protein QQS21_000473 [Conoideocrella luteorostrata]